MVSVIIPIYNGEKYINRCFSRLLSELNGDIEVIAVNDGSTDSSLVILHDYARRYSNMRIVDKEKNQGLPQARLSGLMAALGQYVAFLDVDDYADPSVYALMESKAEATGADMVFCDYTEERPRETRRVNSIFTEGQTLPMSGADALDHLHRRRAVFQYPWNKLFRTELLRKVEFPTGNFVGEDYFIVLRYLLLADKVDYVPMCAYHYVMTENSMSRGGYSENTKRAYEYYRQDEELISERSPHSLMSARRYYVTEYMGFIIAMGRNNTYNKAMIKQIKAYVRKNLFDYVLSKDIPLILKGSACALCISYRLPIMAYRIIKR